MKPKTNPWKKITKKRPLKALHDNGFPHEQGIKGIQEAKLRTIKTREGKVILIRVDFKPTEYDLQRRETHGIIIKNKKRTHGTITRKQITDGSIINEPTRLKNPKLAEALLDHKSLGEKYENQTKLVIDFKENTRKVIHDETAFKQERHGKSTPFSRLQQRAFINNKDGFVDALPIETIEIKPLKKK